LFLLPIVNAFFIFLFAFPTEIYTDYLLTKALNKRNKLRNLQVIAVSGSYGKSTTKEIIAHILSQKFSVAKTPLSQNTPLAVAKSVLRLSSRDNFFIAELGAYKRGEVAQLARIVKPTIGITTSVSDQHLALYGSMKGVIDSEMELVDATGKNSFQILNGNSSGNYLLAKQISKKILWYKTSDKIKIRPNTIIAFNIQPQTNGVSFEISYKKKNFLLFSPLLGVQTVENILPGVLLGLIFGLPDKQVIKAVATLKPMPKTMEKIELFPEVTTIDDTFNASPESTAAAIEYLKLFPKRKILVMTPLIELGQMAKQRHIQLGKDLSSLDFVFLTNKNFLKEIGNGIKLKRGKTKVICDNYKNIADKLKKMVRKGDSIIFEGKEAGIVLQYLKNE